MKLDEKALEAAYSESGAHPWASSGEQCEKFLNAYLSALPSSPVSELEREVKRLREALEFYADTSKYHAPFTGGLGELYYDCGQVARSALSTSPQGAEHE